MQTGVFMHSSWYTVSCFSFFAIAMAMPVHQIHAPNPCYSSMYETTQTEWAIINTQSYCGDLRSQHVTHSEWFKKSSTNVIRLVKN